MKAGNPASEAGEENRNTGEDQGGEERPAAGGSARKPGEEKAGAGLHPFLEILLLPASRDRSFWEVCRALPLPDILAGCEELEVFRQKSDNLYERVRAAFFLYAAYRFFLQEAFPGEGLSSSAPAEASPPLEKPAPFPKEPFDDLLARRFEKAISGLRRDLREKGPRGSVLSALAEAYHKLALQTLFDQVRKSVRQSRGNQWMFRLSHANDYPLRIRAELLRRGGEGGEGGASSLLTARPSDRYPVLCESTPVRLDLSHSGWSDIFFLGMDFPEGARVLNISVDLGVGEGAGIRPPIESYFRLIPEPVIRVTSLDLKAHKDIQDLDDLFNFGNDYLSLLKAGIIASGLVPPAAEGTGQPLSHFLEAFAGPGMGFELVTKVNAIPKGSRLAVSTNLLGSIIALLMRATGQTENLLGPLNETERRLAASRAILGEWLGGSGGGWQDSGGIWPGIKVIEGASAEAGDPEWGVSRGRLLPRHRVLRGPKVLENRKGGETSEEAPVSPGADRHSELPDPQREAPDLHPEIPARLQASLVLLHGGMAQNVGPILEMVTERYLLRSEREWQARRESGALFEDMLRALKTGEVKALAALTQAHWDGPLKSIIPYVSNRFTENIISRAREAFGADFWGFLMLGGMSGGGMGMFVNPVRKAEFRQAISRIMQEEKERLRHALPFAMDPVVYDFRINDAGTSARLLPREEDFLPGAYYSLHLPLLVRKRPEEIAPWRKAEMDHFAKKGLSDAHHSLLTATVSSLFGVPGTLAATDLAAQEEEVLRLKRENGFDPVQHEALRQDLRAGRIGLAHNRLPLDTFIEDVKAGDYGDYARLAADPARARQLREAGEEALRRGEAAVLTLAGGVGSRWTQGAGVIKALSPFLDLGGAHRNFLDIHLAKTRRTAKAFSRGLPIPHLFSTSFMTHAPLEAYLEEVFSGGRSGNLSQGLFKGLREGRNSGPDPLVLLSPGRSLSQRLIPMERDLRFLWESLPQETLDEQKQKKRDAVRQALIAWAKGKGEGSDYRDNLPGQLFNPPGHFYEAPNLLRNGVLARLLAEQPNLKTLLLHNVDTLGADLDPLALGYHRAEGRTLTFEVVPRRIQDRGGGLARVNGKVRLLEGLAQPREEDELALRFYNSMTTWIEIDPFLAVFGLTRTDLLQGAERAGGAGAAGGGGGGENGSRPGPEGLPGGDPFAAAVRKVAARLPTYVTLKDVKLRWGHGQEDVYPVTQFEKLWSDMTGLPDLDCAFLAVPRFRGQQLKDPSELDPWMLEGGRESLARLCEF